VAGKVAIIWSSHWPCITFDGGSVG